MKDFFFLISTPKVLQSWMVWADSWLPPGLLGLASNRGAVVLSSKAHADIDISIKEQESR